MPNVTVQIDATQTREFAVSLELDVPQKVLDAGKLDTWVEENRTTWEQRMIDEGTIDSDNIVIDRVELDQ